LDNSGSNYTIKQTDRVLVNANKKEIIQNIRSMRGPNMDSDRFLQKVISKQKLLTISRNIALQFKNAIKQIYKTK